MTTELAIADCPVCLSAGSLSQGRCQLCEAEFGQAPDGAVDLPPAASPGLGVHASLSAAAPALRFSDVIEELRQVGTLVSNAGGAAEIEAACGRLQALLHALRVQFLTEVVVGKAPVSERRPTPTDT